MGGFIKTLSYTNIINILIEKNNYLKYLEIGCDTDRNFNKIIIGSKIGVDPQKGGTVRMTSDDFFKNNKEFFDIVFIDGLHHADQVYRDVINSLAFLNHNGIIVVHDCNPLNHSTQNVPRQRRQKKWNGDVWKAWLKLRSDRQDLEMFVVNIRNGCGIIRKGKQKLLDKWDIEYAEFEKNKKELLNLVSVDEFMQYINSK